jgi:hypothetical protein
MHLLGSRAIRLIAAARVACPVCRVPTLGRHDEAHTHDGVLQEEVEEVREAAAARRERDRQLTMGERLEKVHHLCAQLSELKPVGSTPGC